MSASTLPGRGEAATAMRPITPSGRPGFPVSSVHVSPPSSLLNMPVPGPPLWLHQKLRRTSHIDAYSTRGLVRSMDRSIAPARSDRYSTRSHVSPPSWSGIRPALRGSLQVAEHGRVHEVGVLGMDANAGDVLRVREADIGPGAPAVGGPVHAVRLRGPLESRHRHAGLAHADVYHVGVGVGDRQCADRRGLEVAVRDVLPVGAAVLRLPDPSDAAHVEGRRLGRMAVDGDAPASLEGPDVAPPEALQQVLSQFHGGSARCLDMKLRTLHRLYGYTPAIGYFHI